MKLYLQVIKFSFLRLLRYYFDAVASVIKRFIPVIFMIVLWTAIAQSNPGSHIDLNSIIAYYFFSSGIAEITMARYGNYGMRLGWAIRDGAINNILVKPVNELLYLYCVSVGSVGFRIIVSVISIIIGLFFQKPENIFSIFAFLIFLILAILNAFAFNVLEGVLVLLLTSSSGIRNTINHIKSLLGGYLLPIYLFPAGIRQVVEILPFAALIYYPSRALTFSAPNEEFWRFLFFGILWAIILNIVMVNLWKWSLRKYEAVGI